MSAISITLQRKPPASWLAIGGMWIVTGLLLNQWAIAAVLEVAQWGRISSALIWGFDLLAIAWGLVTILHSNRNLVKNLNVLALTVVVLLLSVEVVLRYWPSI